MTDEIVKDNNYIETCDDSAMFKNWELFEVEFEIKINKCDTGVKNIFILEALNDKPRNKYDILAYEFRVYMGESNGSECFVVFWYKNNLREYPAQTSWDKMPQKVG
jgi:hypothetical protein